MILAVIPARGGSRRIPRKNIKEFHGKPIIAYSIEAAKESGLFDEIYVSTEDQEIADISQQYGAKWLKRDQMLAHDEVGTQEVMKNALIDLGIEDGYACCIYPVAANISSMDLRSGYALLPGHPYSYVAGLYYWGQSLAFITSAPLSDGFEVPFSVERYVDVNTEEDWDRMKEIYERTRC